MRVLHLSCFSGGTFSHCRTHRGCRMSRFRQAAGRYRRSCTHNQRGRLVIPVCWPSAQVQLVQIDGDVLLSRGSFNVGETVAAIRPFKPIQKHSYVHSTIIGCFTSRAQRPTVFWCLRCAQSQCFRTKLGMGVKHGLLQGMTAGNGEHVAGWASACQKVLIFKRF